MDEDTAALTPRRLPNSEIAHRLGPVLPGPSKPGDLRISFGHRPTPVAPQHPRQVDEWRRAAQQGHWVVVLVELVFDGVRRQVHGERRRPSMGATITAR